mgnify:CR=1 FL=1
MLSTYILRNINRQIYFRTHTVLKALQGEGLGELLHPKCQFLVTEVDIQLHLKAPPHLPHLYTALYGCTCVLNMTGSCSSDFG